MRVRFASGIFPHGLHDLGLRIRHRNPHRYPERSTKQKCAKQLFHSIQGGHEFSRFCWRIATLKFVFFRMCYAGLSVVKNLVAPVLGCSGPRLVFVSAP